MFKLVDHADINPKTFFIGIVGKVLSELLPLICWLMLFGALTQTWLFSFEILLAISLITVVAQWRLGQSAKQSFLGAYDITHQLRKVLLHDIRSQPLSKITGQGLGERIKLITRDLKAFEDIFSHLIADLIAALVIPIAMLCVLLFCSVYLALLMLIVMASASLLLWKFEENFSKQAQRHVDKNASCTNKLLEYIACLPTLKRFGRSEVLAVPLNQELADLRKTGLGVEWAGGMGVILASLLLELSIPMVAALGAYLTSIGNLTHGEWLVSIIAAVACIRPFVRMTIFSTLLRYMEKSADRLYSLSQEPQQPVHGVQSHHYDIKFKGVELTLDGNTILKDINLQVPYGQHIALVGTSGAGKTTLLDLLAAFHIPSHGSVEIGGCTVEATGTMHWYQHISYVTQNVQLFAGTLKDNLLIAKIDADTVELETAITTAGLDDLIDRLPQGLNTEINENGKDLSGGERQRLSLARALLHDAPIVLLDEFTSALDQHKQREILQSITECFASKTMITIAHRFDTIVDADCIYLMNQGRIDDFGSHDQLITTSSYYQSLWEAQHNN
ncbi:ABC transporter ATP-binding protein/permease [Vibrio kasasachensis]|uniref:ABC transporter ATP-binding protein n=1 Tax=Vibrio kasasachensis TaxID=2910248 RepID=UPI003D134813